MKALIIIGCILLVLILLGQLRASVSVRYSESGLFVKVKAGPVRVQIVPGKKDGESKEKKGKQTDTKQSEQDTEHPSQKKNLKDTLDFAVRFIPLLGEAAGKLKKKIQIDWLFLHVIWGASNPASAAMGYGAGHAAMGILWPALEHNFKVKKHDLRVDVDFERVNPAFDADAQVTLTIGQILSMVILLGIKALKIYLGYRRENIEEKAVHQ